MQQNDAGNNRRSDETPPYEAPKIELTISRSEMEREVHYAGRPST